ncbi:MAG: N-6 DNA methylase [Candidatus Dadabacteria bacterium]|nr:N-6 DNA methylase [Candidatus Dadabacteria bacterium]
MSQITLPLFPPSEQTSSLEKSDKLLKVFEDVHNHIYANDGLFPEQALEETIKILFLKIFDEKNKKFEFKITSSEYENIINGKNESDFLSRLYKLQENTFTYFSDLFEKDEKIKLKDNSLAFVFNKLQNIDLLNSSNDVKGLAFQKFIHASQRVGRGQFFTPEQVVKLCVEIIQPKSNEKVLDPACGSGGFLSSTLQYIYLNEPGKAKDFARNNAYGIEINKTAATVAKMMMILDGDGFCNIIRHDSLSDWNSIDAELNKTSKTNLKTYRNYFDIVLTNPPFGTQGKITSKSILKNFDLGYKWNEFDSKFYKSGDLLHGQVPEILFIERCLKFLKPGGRMAIVLPNGDFENSSLSYLRNYIKEQADVLDIIKLPQETFIPSGTGVKTSILFLKKKNDEKPTEKIYFAQVTKLGYAGNKNGSLIYKKDNSGNIQKNEKGEFKVDEDISDVISSYINFKKDKKFNNTENAFLINRDDLNYMRLDFEFYKPSYRETEKILLKNGAKRLGNLLDIKKAKSSKLKQRNLTVRYVELSDISTQYNEITNATEQLVHELPSRASYELKEGDIITAVAGNSIGTNNHVSAYVTKKYDGCICTNGFRVFSKRKRNTLDKESLYQQGSNFDEEVLNPFYLLYFLKSKYFLDQVYRFRTGAAIPSLLDSDLLNILILVPSKEEQNRIGKIVKKGFEQRRKYQDQINNLKINI